MRAVKSLRSGILLTCCAGLAFGCAAAGEETNYRILEQSDPQVDSAPFSVRTGPIPLTVAVFGAVEGEENVRMEAADTATPAATDAPAQADPAATPEPSLVTTPVDEPAQLPVSETEPSAPTLDRSHWPQVTVAPASGVVYHQPHYFSDLPPRRDTKNPYRNDERDEVEQRIDQALLGAGYNMWDASARQQIITQPLKFAYDAFTFPIHAVMTPPWSKAHTP